MYDFWLVDLILDFARLVNRFLRFCHFRSLGPMIWGFFHGLL